MYEKEDVLNREEFINKVINLIRTITENNKSCSFAIDGQWGSGKSFVLDKIKTKLEDEQSETLAGDKYFVFYYNCWEYDYYDEPIISIVSSLWENINQKTKLFTPEARDKFLKMTKAIAKAVASGALKKYTNMDLNDFTSEFIDSATSTATKEYDKYFGFHTVMNAVKKEIEEIAQIQPVVIMVDELDRCLPTYTIKVLERLHHIFDGLENVVQIIALDKHQIKKSLEKIYGNNLDIDMYLRKFISFDLYLDTGNAKNFFIKYEPYISLFSIDDEWQKDIEDFLTNITKGIDIRTQEKLFEKAEALHKLLSTDKLIDCSIFLFEILFLCIKEKTKGDNLQWLIDDSYNVDIENLLGKSEYDLLIQYKKDNLAGEYWNMPHSTECKRIADTPFGKMFFLIAGIYNKNSHGICGPYYYSEYFDDELKFARDVYKLLSI
ncbi:MAG: P-loop NTPase fold protein [Ruminococcus sp.]|uniref:KAP family P-loop NTPase fold protein n=1 Tax=Blautia faecis TaxID=871665 RepID=UPI0016553D5C|nr:P-loop NTPase fold protein [Blautia faecis]MBC8616053.1 hypothetical protein [Blautia faecis]